MKKLIGTSALAAMVALSWPAAAAAQEASLTISPNTIEAGGTVSVSGVCPEGAGDATQVTVLAGEGFPEPGQLGEVPIQPTGEFAGQITIPAGAPAASGQVTVACPAPGNQILNAPLTIVQAAGGVQAPTGGVETGAGGGADDSLVLLLGASGAALALGGGLLAARRRAA